MTPQRLHHYLVVAAVTTTQLGVSARADTPLPVSAQTSRAQLSHHGTKYDGEVGEYVPDTSLTLLSAGGKLPHFSLSEVQQPTGFAPLPPPPPATAPTAVTAPTAATVPTAATAPPAAAAPPAATADVESPYTAVLQSPAERKADAKVLLITGAVFAGIGLLTLTAGAAVFTNVRGGDANPPATIFSIFGLAVGASSLAVALPLLSIGGYRYTTPLAYW